MDNVATKVSTLSRVLAWVVVFCGVSAGVVWANAILEKGLPALSGGVLFGLLSSAFILPLFFYVALKGRSPRWLTSMENIYDKKAKARGIPLPANGGSRRIIPLVGSVVFGLGLIFFGNQIGVFSGETGWFAMSVFAVAWLIVDVIVWRNYKSKPGTSLDEAPGSSDDP